MAFQFGTNWSTLAKMSGPIQGPLLSYETFTAFALEASFFGRRLGQQICSRSLEPTFVSSDASQLKL
jgi:Cytochrome bd terminal oxidase subunit I